MQLDAALKILHTNWAGSRVTVAMVSLFQHRPSVTTWIPFVAPSLTPAAVHGAALLASAAIQVTRRGGRALWGSERNAARLLRQWVEVGDSLAEIFGGRAASAIALLRCFPRRTA